MMKYAFCLVRRHLEERENCLANLRVSCNSGRKALLSRKICTFGFDGLCHNPASSKLTGTCNAMHACGAGGKTTDLYTANQQANRNYNINQRK